MKTSYVSTSIPYVNARPHVGFALELVQADVIARWRRLQGDETYLLTGTDENAFKNVQAAAGEGLTPRRLCDRNALRYYLLRAVRSGEDGDVSEARIRDVYNTDLANGLGNLVRRLEALCERSGYGPADTRNTRIPPDVSGALDRFDFAGALRAIWLRIGELNREIDAVRPWELLKRQKAERLSEHLSAWIGSVLDISWVLRPFLPCTAERIETGLSRSRIRKSQPLFPRLT